MLANDLKSFYALSDDAADSAKEIADYMGSHGFAVKAGK
jgi:hypothetical protein